MNLDSGSFRDPSGRILIHGDRVFRIIFPHGLHQYRAAQDSGVLDAMIESGMVLSAHRVDLKKLDPQLRELVPEAVECLEHPRIDFISYPYEWCFSQLKAAALLHLDLNLALLERGFTLSDASAYNIQFQATRPIFIDHLSIIPYDDGSGWMGQRQFGMQFLNPLYLWAKRGVGPHAWYRGSLEGIPPEDLTKLLGLKDRLSFTVLAHIVGPAAFARRRVSGKLDTLSMSTTRLPKSRFVAMLTSLRDYIAALSPPFEKTVWDDYADNTSYDNARRAAKHAFVAETVFGTSAKTVFDIGCNSGDFSQTALSAGAQSVVGFDFDFGALEKAFSRFSQLEAAVLPLWLDVTNPSPAQGWAGAERKGLQERANADCVLALAVIHHMAIARNVPLDMTVDWLMGLAPTGVIEFPSKSDPMVQQLLRHRADIFPDYTEESFINHVGRRGKIIKQDRLGEDGRLIIAYDQRQSRC